MVAARNGGKNSFFFAETNGGCVSGHRIGRKQKFEF